jgi:two-component system response regulator FixJ
MLNERVVHVVEDDMAFRRSTEALLASAGIATRSYDSAQAVIEAVAQLSGGCILLDIRLPGMNGLDLQVRLKELGIYLPVIVMTGQSDVATAVRAIKAGAIDVIEKPFADDLLLSMVEKALAAAPARASRAAAIATARARIALLSPRERQVLTGIVAGHTTKTIAQHLGISARTVDVHRARMLERLDTHSISEAVRFATLSDMGSKPNEL